MRSPRQIFVGKKFGNEPDEKMTSNYSSQMQISGGKFPPTDRLVGTASFGAILSCMAHMITFHAYPLFWARTVSAVFFHLFWNSSIFQIFYIVVILVECLHRVPILVADLVGPKSSRRFEPISVTATRTRVWSRCMRHLGSRRHRSPPPETCEYVYP